MRNGHGQDAYQQAVGLFEQAIEKDPNFALAYTGLADSSLRMYGETKDSIWAQKATLAAQQAERLSSNLPEVHLSLGSCLCHHRQEHAGDHRTETGVGTGAELG